MASKFENSRLRQEWLRHRAVSPASISEISFRMVNLRAAHKGGHITDPQAIREKLLEMQSDLAAWKDSVPQSLGFFVVDAVNTVPYTCYEGKRHLYPNIWVAEIWNNWRVLRILVNQFIYLNECEFGEPDEGLKATALSIIHEHSVEICESLFTFLDSTRKCQRLSRLQCLADFIRRNPLPYPTAVRRVIGDAESPSHARLCHRAATQYRCIHGNSTSRTAC